MSTKLVPPHEENDMTTVRRLRKAIGWLGISLPFALIILSLIPVFKTEVQVSLSSYYYTHLREIFTGVLCAVGLFLIRYKGYTDKIFWKDDNRMTNLAGAMALGVALMPTSPDACCEKAFTIIPFCDDFLGWFHYIFAALFFIILAVMSFFVFTLGQKKKQQVTHGSFDENTIYRICGCAILVFSAMVPVCQFLIPFPYSTLIFETLTLTTFGISWLIKGRVLSDTGRLGQMLYRENNRRLSFRIKIKKDIFLNVPFSFLIWKVLFHQPVTIKMAEPHFCNSA